VGIITSAVALVLSVVGLVLLVSVLGSAAEDVGTTSAEPAPQPAKTAAPEPEPEPEPEAAPPAEAGIGGTVNDGQFDFVVTAVEPAVETVGESILAEEAQGQFVRRTSTPATRSPMRRCSTTCLTGSCRRRSSCTTPFSPAGSRSP
jgi:hypothetical protein